MLINKADCKVSIKDHTKIQGYLNIFKEIHVFYLDMEFLITNVGIISADIPNICGLKFYPIQAQKYWDNLPEKIELRIDYEQTKISR